MRIPMDSKAMKHIEEKWPRKFKDEPRSIRLGLAMDGVCHLYAFCNLFERAILSQQLDL